MDLLEQKLSRIDLNLLVSLSVLLKEKSVSRAAERLYLSQSAMSRTLQRLRDVFDDPLFHRTATGIVPTEKAQSIESLLPDLLQNLENIFHQEDFCPSTCDKHFSLSIPALMSNVFFLPLVQELTKIAPAIQLTEHPAQVSPFKSLESGFYDFAIYIEKPIDTNFTVNSLGRVFPAIFAHKNHPLARQSEVTLKDCIQYRFLDLHIQGDTDIGFTNPIDKIFFKQGYRRDIQLKSSQFSILTTVLKSTDCLLAGPDTLFNSPENKSDYVRVYEFKKNEENSVEFFLLEHKRSENSPAHQWLKQKIIQLGFLNKTL